MEVSNMIDFRIFKQLYINGVEINSLLLNDLQIWRKQNIVEDEYEYYVRYDYDNEYSPKINGKHRPNIKNGTTINNCVLTYYIVKRNKRTEDTEYIPVTHTLDITFDNSNCFIEDSYDYFRYYDSEYNLDVEFYIWYDANEEEDEVIFTYEYSPDTSRVGDIDMGSTSLELSYYVKEYWKGYYQGQFSKTVTIQIDNAEVGEYSGTYFDEEYKIEIPYTYKVINPYDEYNFIIDGKGYDYIPYLGVKEIIITGKLVGLSANKFKDCHNLKSIVIPTNIKTINTAVFDNCSSLESITFLSPTPPTMDYAFAGSVKANGTVYVPYGSRELYYEIFDDWHDASIIKQGWTVEELPIGEVVSVEHVFNKIETPTVNATDTSYDITYSYKEITTYDSGVQLENIVEFIETVTFNENTTEGDIEITGSFVSEFGDTINYTITQKGASSSVVTLDWGTVADSGGVITPTYSNPYIYELVDAFKAPYGRTSYTGTPNKTYSQLRFTRPEKAAESGYYGDGIDGLIKCVTYNTTSAIYASSTNVHGSLDNLTTWKNQGANIHYAWCDLGFGRYGNDFYFTAPTNVNVLGFCIITGNVADNVRYNRAIWCMPPNTTVNGKPALKISNGEGYADLSQGCVIAILYK